MAELNENKHSKQPDQPDAMWKLDLCLSGSRILQLLICPGIFPQSYHRIPLSCGAYL